MINSGIFLRRVFIVSFYLALLLLFLYTPSFLRKVLHKNRVSVCTFSDLIKESIFEQFHRETGIEVNFRYCDLDSEFWTMLNSGGNDIDIVTPTDFVAARLKKGNLLQKFNRQLFANANDIADKFKTKSFDANLEYMVPCFWTYYVLAYRTSFFEGEQQPNSLSFLFDPESVINDEKKLLQYKIAFLEDNPQELIALAGLFALESLSDFDKQENINKVFDIFKTVKHKWIYNFFYDMTNVRYYLLSATPIMVTLASTLNEAILSVDDDKISFSVPKEGSVIVPQNFCLTKNSQNVEAAHKFIDFCMRPDIMKEICMSSGYLPTRSSVANSLQQSNEVISLLVPNDEDFENLNFVKGSFFTPENTEKLWVWIKAA